VFITITFFLPGFLAKFVSDYVAQAKDASSEVKVTVLSIVWNIPSIFGGWAVMSAIHHKLLTSSQFMKDLQSLPWMGGYFVIATVVDFGIGQCVLKIFKNVLSRTLNKARTDAGLPQISDGLPWEKFIGTEESSIIKIYLLGKPTETLIGILETAYQQGDEQRGITLSETGEYQLFSDILQTPSRTFVEFDSQLVFEIFTKTDLEKLTISPPQDSHE
jgi:hypothetical protein